MTSLVRTAGRAIALCLALAGMATAQTWPDRPIRMLISFPPGGSSDAIGRIVQPGLEKRLGQPIVLENRPGAGGMIAIDAVAKAAPDGYTIGLGGAGALGGNVALGEKMPYDPRKDLAPVTVLSRLAVHPGGRAVASPASRCTRSSRCRSARSSPSATAATAR